MCYSLVPPFHEQYIGEQNLLFVTKHNALKAYLAAPLRAEGGCGIDSVAKIVQVAAGRFHTCALIEGGAVRCWGQGGTKLGYPAYVDDSIGDDETPAFVGDVDVGGAVVQLAAGGSHTCAILDTGVVRCWGLNGEGQTGYPGNTGASFNEPPSAAGDVNVGGSATQITAGMNHTCALLATGNVRCWGRNADGQLGYPDYSSLGKLEAPAVAGDVDIGGRVIQIAAAYAHTCALLDTGDVKCWGEGGPWLGYVNSDTIGDDETPATVGTVDVGGVVVQIATGGSVGGVAGDGSHTCALLNTGALRCWGTNKYGQIGYPGKDDIGEHETPASVGDVPVL